MALHAEDDRPTYICFVKCAKNSSILHWGVLCLGHN